MLYAWTIKEPRLHTYCGHGFLPISIPHLVVLATPEIGVDRVLSGFQHGCKDGSREGRNITWLVPQLRFSNPSSVYCLVLSSCKFWLQVCQLGGSKPSAIDLNPSYLTTILFPHLSPVVSLHTLRHYNLTQCYNQYHKARSSPHNVKTKFHNPLKLSTSFYAKLATTLGSN